MLWLEVYEEEFYCLYLQRLLASSVRIVGRVPYHILWARGRGQECGHPLSNNLKCNSATAQLHFETPDGQSYRVTGIDAKKHKFTVELRDSKECWKPGSQSRNFNLNSSLLFYITEGNSAFLLNCSTDNFISSDFNCSLSSECRSFNQDGQAPCINGAQSCCSYRSGATALGKYSVSLAGTHCGTLSSVVGRSPPPWREGLEIGWNISCGHLIIDSKILNLY